MGAFLHKAFTFGAIGALRMRRTRHDADAAARTPALPRMGDSVARLRRFLLLRELSLAPTKFGMLAELGIPANLGILAKSGMRAEQEIPAILREISTDETIDELYRAAEELNERDELVERWGVAVSRSDLHSSGPLRSDYD